MRVKKNCWAERLQIHNDNNNKINSDKVWVVPTPKEKRADFIQNETS